MAYSVYKGMVLTIPEATAEEVKQINEDIK